MFHSGTVNKNLLTLSAPLLVKVGGGREGGVGVGVRGRLRQSMEPPALEQVEDILKHFSSRSGTYRSFLTTFPSSVESTHCVKCQY